MVSGGPGTKGSNSIFSTITSTGGGGGGQCNGGNPVEFSGDPGGSGGGGGQGQLGAGGKGIVIIRYKFQ
jgi:hypothetical protein